MFASFNGVDRRTVTASVALSAAALLLPGGTRAYARTATATASGITLRLPPPTGPYRTGITTLYLVDDTRRDPWTRTLPVREVMVTLFYPAVRGCRVAPQMTQAAAALFPQLDAAFIHPLLPKSGVNWAATPTHSLVDAPALPGRRPVLLYSPGAGDPRTMGTHVAEELASHGFVVVTVDHPGDAGEVEFPVPREGRKGLIRETELRPDAATDPGVFRTVVGTRVTDIRFVLDQLAPLASGRSDAAGRRLPQELGRSLDLRRVGVYGHSAGGTTAAQAIHEDRRIRAAVNLEGYLDLPPRQPGTDGELFPVARHGIDRPLLLLGTDGFHDERFERSWSALLSRSPGCVARRRLGRADHWVFTDYAALVPQLEAAGLMTAEGRAGMVGEVDPAVSVPWVRERLRAFFVRYVGEAMR
ncbi:alpha/beta hydrolase family protein [Streptomyces sp. NPDC059828]|uniref:alpha/beta hydrolase family protein n=1 Tax=Streptomyces sp. NPDC059828 TaxID=3346965 RepID=UPI0036564650